MGLAVAVALPLAALAAWRALDRRAAELEALESEARSRLAQVTDALQAELDDSRAVLLGIGRLVDVGAPAARNDALLREFFREASLRFSNVWVITPDGRNVGALRLPPGGRDAANLGADADVQRARGSGRFTVGGVRRSQVLEGRPFVLTMHQPIVRGTGPDRVVGLVGAALLVDSLAAMRASRILPTGSVITVQDSTGRILMRSRDAERWIGREFGGTRGFADVVAVGAGVDKTRSADGVVRQIAFRMLDQPRWIVYVGIPEAATIAVVQRQFIFDVGVGLLVTLVVLVVAFGQVGRIVEPIEALTRDAAAIAGGDEERRSRIDTPDEIGDLARALNRMADTAVARRQAIAEDAERRRAAERALEESRDQLRQAQKMEAMGSFAGGIAHDFNNYLSSIVGYAEMALTQLDDRPAAAADVQEVLAAAHRAAELTRQILVFSRRTVVEPQVLDVADVVRGIGRLLVPLVGEGVHLGFDLADAALLVRADKGQLEQVIVNLAANARDAMPHGGSFSIATTRLLLEDDAVAHPGVPAGDWVVLAATDTGVGMAPEVRDRVFEPFFTTKERGRGTGLGLAMVYSMVQQAGGVILVDSAPGEGTTFRLYLRRVATGAYPALPQTPPPAGRGAGERILVAEDDAAVRSMTVQMLRRAGYVVEDVPDGASALSAIAHQPPFALLLTDVVMPGLNGRELLARVRRDAPDLPVLVMSGYADDDALVREVRASAVPYLAKPFTAAQLLERVRTTLSQRR